MQSDSSLKLKKRWFPLNDVETPVVSWKIVKGRIRRFSEVYMLEQFYIRLENTLAKYVSQENSGTFHVPNWYKYTGNRKMSIPEKLLAIVFCRPRLRVEDAIENWAL